jgi:hypothetical protein
MLQIEEEEIYEVLELVAENTEFVYKNLVRISQIMIFYGTSLKIG